MSAAAHRALDDQLEFERFTRWVGGGDRPRLAESSLRIGGMHCAACAGSIEDALRAVDGVLDAQVSPSAQCATVRWDPHRTRPSALVDAVEKLGYGAAPDTGAAARALRLKESRQALWRLFVAGFCAMQVMMLAAPSYLGAPGDLAPDLKQLLDWGSWLLTLPVMAFSAGPFFGNAWRALRNRRIDMDVPVALGLAVAFVASSGAAFDPGGPFGSAVYFDSLTMFVSFLLGGRYLELRARHAALRSLEGAIGRLPQTVLRETASGDIEPVSALRLARGDRVRVPRGEAFAADGVLLAGSTQADESLLNGEAAPQPKAPGDAVIAGSLNLGAPVLMRVERVGADTRYEAIVALMRHAQTQRPSATRSADRWAAPFLWAVLLLAAGAAAVWSLVEPGRAVWVAVSVLIVTCPCALSLAAPSAWLAGASAIGRRGVLLRRVDAIEDLAAMRTLFLDKTGTLTEAGEGDAQMNCLDSSFSEAELWARAATLAAWSSHPLAQALAQRESGTSFCWSRLHEMAGQGIGGDDEAGVSWLLGKGPAGPSDTDANETWLMRQGQPVARFSITERVRDGAADAIRALQQDGVRLVLVSGDVPQRVQRLAEALGLDDWHAQASPEDKLSLIRAAQAGGERVAMLGDGINDAPVLAQADVSLAMGAGAEIARQHADGVLLSNRLGDVAQARRVAVKTLRIVRQNLAWAALYNAACVPLALGGWLPPWAAGLGMAASSLGVVLNSLRLSR